VKAFISSARHIGQLRIRLRSQIDSSCKERDLLRCVKFVHPDLGITLAAELLDDLNPDLCNSIWKSLPIKSSWVHAMISGELMYFWADVIHTKPPQHTEMYPKEAVGRVNYSYVFQDICIKYGEKVTEPSWANPWAQIRTEDLKELSRLGRAVWESNYLTHTPIRLTVERE